MAKLGVRIRLYVRLLPSETLQQIMGFLLSSFHEIVLDPIQLTSFCADYAPINFGGLQLSEQNNVFYRLKERAT